MYVCKEDKMHLRLCVPVKFSNTQSHEFVCVPPTFCGGGGVKERNKFVCVEFLRVLDRFMSECLHKINVCVLYFSRFPYLYLTRGHFGNTATRYFIIPFNTIVDKNVSILCVCLCVCFFRSGLFLNKHASLKSPFYRKVDVKYILFPVILNHPSMCWVCYFYVSVHNSKINIKFYNELLLLLLLSVFCLIFLQCSFRRRGIKIF